MKTTLLTVTDNKRQIRTLTIIYNRRLKGIYESKERFHRKKKLFYNR